MAGARERQKATTSPLLSLLGLAVLGVVGFGLGLVAGGLWEEPDLVLRHVFGGSQEVAWGPGRREPLAGPAAVAAAGEVRPAPDPRAVAAPPPGGRHAVQVGAFRDSRAAEKLAESLRAKGYGVYLSPGASAGDARWRVRVGPLDTREEAERTAAQLKSEERLPTWVLDEDAG